MKIGITGQAGFVGTWLYNSIGLKSEISRVPFEDSFFEDNQKLNSFVKECDIIIHLAAMNRHPDPEVIYNTNIKLVISLIDALNYENVKPHIVFSSSTQEDKDNLYGRSKKEGRELIESWASNCGASFTGLVIPNVFGPFSKPNYNTFIATFAQQLINGETPIIETDGIIKLIYIGSLCEFIFNSIINKRDGSVERIEVPYDFECKVSSILAKFKEFNTLYNINGIIPRLNDLNEINLFNTFRSYLDHSTRYPYKLKKNWDSRGVFVETLKVGIGGQVSFSTTLPGITRGNHFHSRKIERFTVIKGKARIQLRKIGSKEIINFYLDGEEPSYVDMPIWYTHNITNIGNDELYTQFWINEWFNPEDGDTYFEEV